MMKQGFVRIIGGEWRGRRLPVPSIPYLRPTPDRVRETLFNWLSTHLTNSLCLDLFAGSGVLGFEAASRGAKKVVLVDNNQEIIQNLIISIQQFHASQINVYCKNAPYELTKEIKEKFDIVFLDPPYQSSLLFETANYLEKNEWLSDHAMIYLEADYLIQNDRLPSNWVIIKQKKAGQVFYHLVKREKKNE